MAGCGVWVTQHQERLWCKAGKIADAVEARNQYGRAWTGGMRWPKNRSAIRAVTLAIKAIRGRDSVAFTERQNAGKR